MSKPIGIDLGTTNSCASYARGLNAEVIANRQGYRTTPSMYAVSQNGKHLVGHLAKRQAVTNPTGTIYASKRLIGRRYSSPEIERAKKMYPYKLLEGENQDVRLGIGDEVITPQEVAARILTDIRDFASESLGEEVTSAVITVPAYFNDNQRQATKDAGRIAGLEVLRIINEPTAACIAYGLGAGKKETIAVYDFGGGTFDISVVKINKSVFEVLATGGDTFLGGEDVDIVLMEVLLKEIKNTHGLDLSGNALALQRIKSAAEDAKINLSFQVAEEISLPFLAANDAGEPINFSYRLTRQQLEELAKPLIEKSLRICDKVLTNCNLSPMDLAGIILVGGQTRMPIMQKMVAEHFGQAPRKGINPDEVVAIGAGIEAAMLVDESSEVLLLDVCPLSLGISTQGDIFSVLIERNTPVPAKQHHVFTTVQDKQESVRILVYQGEHGRASENELLGEFNLTGIRPAGRGEPKIEVEFGVSAEGLVTVSAKDMDTGSKQQINVSSSSQLSEPEIQQLVGANQRFSDELQEYHS